MLKIRISAVSYLNTLPFIYGIENSLLLEGKYILEKDIPSICAEKLINNTVDLGLIPVAEIYKVKKAQIVSDYCIGAYGKVKTVLLDYQSRTSIRLVQILAQKYWKTKMNFISAKINFEKEISGNTAGVIIGDRTFNMNKKYKYIFDLSEEWTKFTKLPFVFAVWVANKTLNNDFISNFNKACKFGLDNINELVKKYLFKHYISNIELEYYLNNNINYLLDEKKIKGMKKFLNFEI